MRRQALLISNSQYQDPKLRTLQTPAADVQALHAVLADPRIGNFDVEALVDQNMDQTRRQIARFFSQRKPDDMLLLYFTGHGVLNDESRLHLATVDTEHDIPEASAVEASFVAARMKRCRAKSQILILDCCHSGAFAKESTKGKNVGDSVGTRSAFDGTGHVILTASDMLQYAYEGDEVAGQAVLSVFTHFLVDGLQSGAADLNSDGQITADELYDYVYQRMQDEASDGQRQTPLRIVPRQQGEIVVASNPFAQQTLPPGIQDALDNPLLEVRLVAVQMLTQLVGNGRYDVIARATLKDLTEDDSRTVSNAARQALNQPTEIVQTEPVPAKLAAAPATPKPDPLATLRKTMPLSLEMAFCYVPPGPFTMGSSDQDKDARDNEKPQHTVDIPYGYFISQTPVTNAQFQEFMNADGYAQGAFWLEAKKHGRWEDGKVRVGKSNTFTTFRNKPDRYSDKKFAQQPNYPVAGITWYEALAYCRWLTQQLQEAGCLINEVQITLPTEAEWEKVARGGHEVPSSPLFCPAHQLNVLPNQLQLERNPLPARIYPWGDQFESSYVNSKASNIGATSAVDAYPQGSSPYGVLDMAGNVWEWTRSLWGYNYPYDRDDGREQLDASDTTGRTLRGGAYYVKKNHARGAFRNGYNPSYRDYYLGFRVVARRPHLPLDDDSSGTMKI